MIDWQRVNVLRQDVGPDDFDEVVELFLDEVENVVTRLRDNPNAQTLCEDLHFLKGSAMSLGFSAFSAHCHSGEVASAQGHPDQVNVEEILSCYDMSKQLFLAELPTALAS